MDLQRAPNAGSASKSKARTAQGSAGKARRDDDDSEESDDDGLGRIKKKSNKNLIVVPKMISTMIWTSAT